MRRSVFTSMPRNPIPIETENQNEHDEHDTQDCQHRSHEQNEQNNKHEGDHHTPRTPRQTQNQSALNESALDDSNPHNTAESSTNSRFASFILECLLCATDRIHATRLRLLSPLVLSGLKDIVADANEVGMLIFWVPTA